MKILQGKVIDDFLSNYYELIVIKHFTFFFFKKKLVMKLAWIHKQVII